MTIVDLWPSNAYAQATLGVGSVNFRAAAEFFRRSDCVLCVLSNTCFEMHDVHILCQGSGFGHDGLCSILCPLVFRTVNHVLCMYHVQCNV